jgi:accessory colonization factor AcfC
MLAMRESAAAFGAAYGITVEVTAGPMPAWIEKAKADADVVFSGSETMMTDFAGAFGGQVDPVAVQPLYLRPAAILVRPGNPGRITGLKDLLQPGPRVLVVNGAGQNGMWEDVAGRLGDIASVRAFRTNIATHAANSALARQAWTEDGSLYACLIWSIWQVSNPTLANQVAIEPEYRIYRDTGAVLTHRDTARADPKEFGAYLASADDAKIFAKWGWITPATH